MALPELPTAFSGAGHFPSMRGPLPWCNWAVPGRVLAGAFPASMDDEDTFGTLTTLLELGINSFVCLQSELSLDASEEEWRAGRALRCAPARFPRARSPTPRGTAPRHPRQMSLCLRSIHRAWALRARLRGGRGCQSRPCEACSAHVGYLLAMHGARSNQL